jgi:glyoxylase-like metal-dependent hydrolase (beta-lactamase superfamily II)
VRTIAIGDLRIDHVEEFCFSEAPAHEILADLPDDAVERHLHWLAPDYYDLAAGKIISSNHSWVIRTPHHIVVVDTCCGNDKSRPNFPMCDRLQLPWLERLAACGVRPEQVDFVMCTHLHLDHVGWNTRLLDGRWVPTFPNARYIFGRREYEYWQAMEARGERDPINENVFADSVLPVIEAQQGILVDDGYSFDDSLTVESCDGHSDGHMLLKARSNDESGVFFGDMMHTPLQIPYPDVNSIFCQFPERARATRRRVLSECAERGHLMLPAHFPAPHVLKVAADRDAFEVVPL